MTDWLIRHSWELLPLLALLAGSAFFSGTETACFSLSRGQLHRMRGEHAAGRMVATLLAKPRRLLNTLLLGNMLVNVAYTAITAVSVLDLKSAGAPPWAVAALSFVPLLALILLGEVGPKAIGYALNRRWAMVSALPIYTIQRALFPLVKLFEVLAVNPLTRLLAPRQHRKSSITSDELGSLMDLSAKRGVITPDVHELLQEIFELQDIRVGEVLVPRVDMIAHDLDAPRKQLVDLFRRTRLRRIPVYRGDLDHVLGVVHAKRVLMNPEVPLKDMLVPVIFVPEAATLERTLVQLRARRRQMAVVVDEYGGTAGLVTMEDILEQIVGDIPDADRREDQSPSVQHAESGEYLVDADLSVHDWAEAFGDALDLGRVRTVGGLVMSLLGRVPAVGDEVEYRNLTLIVDSMRGRRIGKVRIRLGQEAQP